MNMTISQLSRESIGYHALDRMEPVHFATSFLLCLYPRYRRLEWLNKSINPKAAEKRPGDEYVAENLYPILKKSDLLSELVSIEDFKTLRNHLSATFSNDKPGAASAAFQPYSTFGCDYSAPTLSYLSNLSKRHGNSGAFVWLVLNHSETGRQFLKLAQEIAMNANGPEATLGSPLLEPDEFDWTSQAEELCGNPSLSKLTKASHLMELQTESLLLLAQNIQARPSPCAVRKLIIGVGSWLLVYQIRHIVDADESIFFSDLSGEIRPRIRTQAMACYARQVGLFGRSLRLWLDMNAHALDTEEIILLFEEKEAKTTKDLEDHFRDFSQRIGWVQPRSANAKKFFRAVPDTMKVLLLSILKPGEIITMEEVAERLRCHWRLIFGLLPKDHDILRKHGYSPLDEDADLRANREGFLQLAVSLGFAWEPSDGLVYFSLTPDQII